MGAIEARTPSGADGVEVRTQTHKREHAVPLEIHDMRSKTKVGHCLSHRRDHIVADIPEDFRLTANGREYALPVDYRITTCPICMDHLTSCNRDETPGPEVIHSFLHSHWEDLEHHLTDILELVDGLTSEEEIQELREHVEQLERTLDDVVERVEDLEDESPDQSTMFTTENTP